VNKQNLITKAHQQNNRLSKLKAASGLEAISEAHVGSKQRVNSGDRGADHMAKYINQDNIVASARQR